MGGWEIVHKIIRRTLAFIAVSICLLHICTLEASAAPEGTSVFTEEEQAFIKDHEPLKVGFVQDRIPVSFSDENGELKGITRYILDRIARTSGFEFEYVPLPAGSVTYDYLLGEGFDLVTSVEYNEENQKARGILMSDPYLSSRKVIVARDGLEFSEDKNFSVAVSTGSQTLKKVLAAEYPNFSLLDYDSIEACFDAVNKGEADLMIQNQYVVEYWLYKPVYEDLKVIPLLGLDDQLCFSAVVSFDENGDPVGTDGRMVIDILDKAIGQLDTEVVGSYTIRAVMENQYSFTAQDLLYYYRYPATALALAAVLIVVLASLLTRLHVRSAEARANEKVKNQFLSTMSHEIRTPLNGLVGLNYLMSRKLHDEERMASYLQQSTMTAKYLMTLVDDLLDMSDLQNQKTKINLQPLDLELLVSTSAAIASGGMSDRHLEFAVDTEIPYPHLVGDEIRIQQVLLNLLDNARKFTPEGGHVTFSVRQELQEDGTVCTRADIADTGRGIGEEFQKYIFHSFTQEKETVSKGNQGTGLGLSISCRLARLMGGDITFTSHKGEGSVFTFTFSAKLAEESAGQEDKPANGDKQPPAAAEGTDKPRVLVAEDNELNSEILLELLEEENFTADLAVNGREALRMFEESAPGEYGIILMDLLMPEMDGFETAAAIRALRRKDAKTVHIFACSANCSPEDQRKARESGMDDFLPKPIDVEELIKKLNEYKLFFACSQQGIAESDRK